MSDPFAFFIFFLFQQFFYILQCIPIIFFKFYN